MAPDKKKIAGDCWRKGSEAMSKENWDYAVDMFARAVMLVPDNLVYRQTLRGVETRKYNNNGTGAKMAGMKLVSVRGKTKKARLKQNWGDLDKAAEEGLAINPWDAQLNADVGDACKNQGFIDVALFAYQKAVQSDPNNKEFLKVLAELYEQRGEYPNAVEAWERIRKIDPLDAEARTKANALAATSVMDRGGYEEADTTKDAMADHEVAKRLGKSLDGEADGPGQSEEADLQRAIRKDPENKDVYIHAADFYKREGESIKALPMLQKAYELSGGNEDLKEQVEDVELEIFKKDVDKIKDVMAKRPNDEGLKKRFKKKDDELVTREIDVFKKRVERHNNDVRYKFQLAKRYVKKKQYTDAIPLLQQSVRDNRIAAEALVMLGKCFLAEKKGGLAKRQFDKAIPLLDPTDDADAFCEAHYWMGRICQEQGDLAAAEDHYGAVVECNYNFKDALKRLEQIQED
ncbi:MAG: hypothetical protein CMJ78_19475 [Planctomycetaceae bacterium]|nr:hypothetical protein [Planctomycetaceae bacterium]